MQRGTERERFLTQFNLLAVSLSLSLALSPSHSRPVGVKTEMAKLTNVDNGSQSDKRTDFDTQAHRKFCCNEPATDKQAGKKGRGKWKKKKGGEWATTSSECPGDRQRLTGIQQLVIRCCTDSWGRAGLGSRRGCRPRQTLFN